LVPVLQAGNCTIEIFPNIKENTKANSQKYYKPYESYKITADLIKGEITPINPNTTYRAQTTFRWIEDF
jgi:hypothetical protein